MQKQEIKVRGFIRTCLRNVKTGEIVLSKWIPNVITEDGFDNYIVGAIGALGGSKQITHLQIATQTATPVSTQGTASGEFGTRKSASLSLVGAGTLQATASWATNEATQSNMGAICVYNTSAGGSAGSIGIFSTSAKTTDQTFNATYQWRFS